MGVGKDTALIVNPDHNKLFKFYIWKLVNFLIHQENRSFSQQWEKENKYF